VAARAGGEEFAENVQFVAAAFGGGVQIGLHDAEVNGALQDSPVAAGSALLNLDGSARSVG